MTEQVTRLCVRIGTGIGEIPAAKPGLTLDDAERILRRFAGGGDTAWAVVGDHAIFFHADGTRTRGAIPTEPPRRAVKLRWPENHPLQGQPR